MASAKQPPRGGPNYPLDTTQLRITKVVHTRLTPFGLKIRKWPKKRPAPPTPAQQQARDDFALMVNVVKQIPAWDRVAATTLAHDTGWTWRDVLSAAVSGTLWRIDTLQSAAVPFILDALSSIEGAILYRSHDGWVGLAPSADGDVLVLTSGFPSWIDPSTLVLDPSKISDTITTAKVQAVVGLSEQTEGVSITNGSSGYFGMAIGPASGIGTTFFELDGADNAGVIEFVRQNGPIGSPTPIIAGDQLGISWFAGWDGSGFAYNASIDAHATENWTGSNHGCQINIQTTANVGAGGLLRPRLVFDGNGHTHVQNGVLALDGAASGGITFSALPPGPTFGMLVPINDATVSEAGTIISTGGGTHKVLGFYDGTNWRVAGGTPAASSVYQLTGDVLAGPGTGTQAASLSASGVSAGTYSWANITVDAKGRVTSAVSGVTPTGTEAETLIATVSLAGASSAAFNSIGAYHSYALRIKNAVPATNGATIGFRVRTGSTPTPETSNYKVALRQVGSGGFESTVTSDSTSSIMIVTGGGNSGPGASVTAMITKNLITGHAGVRGGDGHYYSMFVGGDWEGTTTITGYDIILSTGTWSSGEVSLYGLSS